MAAARLCVQDESREIQPTLAEQKVQTSFMIDRLGPRPGEWMLGASNVDLPGRVRSHRDGCRLAGRLPEPQYLCASGPV
jgi:hypothetical protein